MIKEAKKWLTILSLTTSLIACGSKEANSNKEKPKIPPKIAKVEKKSTKIMEEAPKKIDQSQIKPGLESYYFEERDGKNIIVLEFYRDIEIKDLNGYIDIEGKNMGLSKKNITSGGNKIYIHEQFLPKLKYKITLFKGLTGLNKDKEITIQVPSKKPNIEFKSNGIYMASSLDKKLRIRTLNLKSAKLIVKKISLKDLNLYIYQGGINSGKDNDYNSSRVAETIYSKEISIKGDKDKWVESDIDLSFFDADKSLVNGIYSVELDTNDDNTMLKTTDSFYKDIEKTVIISNIGILAKKYKDKTIITVKSLEDNSAISDAEVFVGLKKYNTDNDGKLIIPATNWDKILVKKDDNIAFLNSKNYVDYSLADNSGIDKNNNINPYIYLTQGVFRPGDKINISTILFEKDKIIPDNQKLIMEIYTPKGGLYTTINGESKGNSLYTFNFQTKDNDFTGEWTAELYLGKSDYENLIGRKNISIETIVPPSIEVNNNSVISDKVIKAKINSKYLFGAVGKNLDYKVTLSNSISKKKFKGYENFNFIGNSDKKLESEETKDGKLDENGNGLVKFNITTTKPPYMMDYHVKSEVFQNDGRKVVKTKTLTYNPYTEYVGIERKDNDYFEEGKELPIKVVALSKDGKKLDETLKYNIYENTSYYWWDYSNYNEFRKHYKSSPKTTLYSTGEVKSGENINFKVPRSGYFYVEVINTKTHHSAGTMIETSYWGSGNSKNDTFVKIDLNQKSYNVGDKASITFKSPSTGKAIINIENGKNLLQSNIINLKQGDNEFEFKTTKDMFPGAYVNVIMLQDLKKKKNDRDLKLQGLKYFKVKDETTVIPITIKNKKVYKNAKNIEISLKGKAGMTYTVAAVDIGVLNMTNFKTPNPYDYFYQKQRYSIDNYDNYKQVLDYQKDSAYNTFKPGGGAALKNKRENSLSKKPRFKIASQFKSGTTDENGDVNLKFNLGNYMGKVKFMVVGVKDNKIGRVEATSEIKDDIVLLPGAPRSLTPLDKFTSNLTIFVNNEYSKSSKVTLETKGPINIIGKKQYEFDGSKLGQSEFKFNLEVGNSFGNGRLTYTVTSQDGKKQYQNTINIEIEPKLDTINYSKSYTIEPNKTIAFKAKKEAIKNSSKSKVIISKFPLKGLYGRLRYLIQYPYGCVEQTTSSVFPQLYIENFMDLTVKEKNEVDKNIVEGIERLEKFQLNNGSLSYWIGENETSDWGTNYAYFFLLSAKDRGYYIPDKMLNNLRSYMIRMASSTRERNLVNLQRLFLLALDNKANLSAMNYYKQNYINKMSNLEKLLLASSYNKAGYSKTAKSLIKNIDINSIGEEYNRYWYYSFGSRLRDKSLALISIDNLKTKEEKKILQDNIYSELSSDNWFSTQTTAYSLLAVSKNIERESDKEVKYSYTNPKSVLGLIKSEKSFTGKSDIVDLKKLQGKKVSITNKSNSTLYATYYFEGVLDPKDQINYSNEIGLSVKYYTEDGVEIPSLASLRKGESVWGIYTISKKDNKSYSEIVLNQNLASGIEIENLRLNNNKTPKWLEKYQNYIIDLRYQDIKDSRVSYFMDLDDYSYNYYSPKNSNMDYGYIILKLNAVTKGKFFMPGPTIKDMYHNEVGAGLKGFYLEVK